jgi:hypothetical protein
VKLWNAVGAAAPPCHPAGAAADNECRERCGNRAVEPFARLLHQPLDLEPLRHRLVDTWSYRACSASAIARHDCTRAASSGWVASHASTSPRRSAGSSLST